MYRYFLIVIVFIIVSCSNKDFSETKKSELVSRMKLKYANKFEIEYFKNFKKIKVKNPWQVANDVNYEYFLYSDDASKEIKNLPNSIQVPVEKLICFSTTHIGMLDFIDEINTIAGVSGINYINNDIIKDKYKNNLIKDVGYENNLNIETIIALKPDVVFLYGVNATSSAMISKLNQFNIKTVIIAEYLEDNPLGKTEWIKFVSAFFNKEDYAANKFETICNQYNSIKQKLINIANIPTVLCNIPYKGTWYVPGGKSFTAKFISDAGGNYLWNDNNSKETLPLSLENVYKTGHNADYWINTGTAHSIAEMKSIDDRLLKFKPILNGKVYNNDAQMSESGGNDFWESGTMNPHIILEDMAKIFHPELFEKHNMVYYRELKAE